MVGDGKKRTTVYGRETRMKGGGKSLVGGGDPRAGRTCRQGLTEKEGKEEGWWSVEGEKGGSGACGGDDRRGWRCCDLAAAAT